MSEEDVIRLIKNAAAKHCVLDHIPTCLLKDNICIFVPIITHYQQINHYWYFP